jgi:hypothetical protein
LAPQPASTSSLLCFWLSPRRPRPPISRSPTTTVRVLYMQPSYYSTAPLLRVANTTTTGGAGGPSRVEWRHLPTGFGGGVSTSARIREGAGAVKNNSVTVASSESRPTTGRKERADSPLLSYLPLSTSSVLPHPTHFYCVRAASRARGCEKKGAIRIRIRTEKQLQLLPPMY